MIGADFLRDTRTSYDTVATSYAEHLRDELANKPWDRAVLTCFAELVRADGNRPVADLGCGPGRIAGYLHGLGLDVSGVDLSPGMIETARAAHPGLRFTVGSMTDLDLPDATLGGVVAWYSTIHLPDELLPATFAEFRRVLAPGGHLVLAFQVGDEPLHLTEALGHPVSLTFRRRQPDRVAELLIGAGFELRTRSVRDPETFAGRTERTPHAYLLARRPADS
ncbi:class I SAM-dependent methyltransferase [Micromonospora sp. C28SCA-DRY-2]|uniref:class I SAM-dependent DNA methyltransferase n=1 Tax=Micromonospora sp. C28SCA-DRY-2 TaxID=3059522 RepID=UPI00267615F1|nr:class I SAM-dependent methyltransferase [Micromonospora sp. C28SCA-DRY-2]MDO3701415.1 class I SAM-dependent methyltransferase [Micromonospora sp. C28SCA-DRY-2]